MSTRMTRALLVPCIVYSIVAETTSNIKGPPVFNGFWTAVVVLACIGAIYCVWKKFFCKVPEHKQNGLSEQPLSSNDMEKHLLETKVIEPPMIPDQVEEANERYERIITTSVEKAVVSIESAHAELKYLMRELPDSHAFYHTLTTAFEELSMKYDALDVDSQSYLSDDVRLQWLKQILSCEENLEDFDLRVTWERRLKENQKALREVARIDWPSGIALALTAIACSVKFVVFLLFGQKLRERSRLSALVSAGAYVAAVGVFYWLYPLLVFKGLTKGKALGGILKRVEPHHEAATLKSFVTFNNVMTKALRPDMTPSKPRKDWILSDFWLLQWVVTIGSYVHLFEAAYCAQNSSCAQMLEWKEDLSWGYFLLLEAGKAMLTWGIGPSIAACIVPYLFLVFNFSEKVHDEVTTQLEDHKAEIDLQECWEKVRDDSDSVRHFWNWTGSWLLVPFVALKAGVLICLYIHMFVYLFKPHVEGHAGSHHPWMNLALMMFMLIALYWELRRFSRISVPVRAAKIAGSLSKRAKHKEDDTKLTLFLTMIKCLDPTMTLFSVKITTQFVQGAITRYFIALPVIAAVVLPHLYPEATQNNGCSCNNTTLVS